MTDNATPDFGDEMSADGNGGYGETSVRTILRDAGLRPTRQRIALGEILFGSGNRHVTAEMVYDEALGKSVPVSLATIYNTLHQFTAVGLLREVVVDSSKTYFDTNTSDHHHVFVEGRDEIIDLPENAVEIGTIGPLPSGAEISRVDVVVRVRRAR